MTSTTQSKASDYIAFYEANNINVFPLPANSKKAANSWKKCQEAKYEDFDELRSWKGNIAVVCGKISGDLKIRDIETWDVYEGFFSDIDTFTVKTPHGGVHLYFRSPNGQRRIDSVNGWPVEVRGEGHYCVGPGSKLDGSGYEVIKDKPITAEDLTKAAFERLVKLDNNPENLTSFKSKISISRVISKGCRFGGI